MLRPAQLPSTRPLRSVSRHLRLRPRPYLVERPRREKCLRRCHHCHRYRQCRRRHPQHSFRLTQARIQLHRLDYRQCSHRHLRACLTDTLVRRQRIDRRHCARPRHRPDHPQRTVRPQREIRMDRLGRRPRMMILQDECRKRSLAGLGYIPVIAGLPHRRPSSIPDSAALHLLHRHS